MKLKILSGIILVLVLSTVIFYYYRRSTTKTIPVTTTEIPSSTTPPVAETPAKTIVYPIAGGNDRVTKITFGQYVSPQNAPFQPFRFTGYHTGWDFEITEAELNQDVPITAVCAGPISYRASVDGYGGVTIQACKLNDQPITVLYGHLRLSSIVAKGTELKIGDQIGLLGNANSPETDGERKHLHFDIHRGAAIELKGYVQNQADLSTWIDPTEFFK